MKKLLKKLNTFMSSDLGQTIVYTALILVFVQMLILNIIIRNWKEVFDVAFILVLVIMLIFSQRLVKKALLLVRKQQELILMLGEELKNKK